MIGLSIEARELDSTADAGCPGTYTLTATLKIDGIFYAEESMTLEIPIDTTPVVEPTPEVEPTAEVDPEVSELDWYDDWDYWEYYDCHYATLTAPWIYGQIATQYLYATSAVYVEIPAPWSSMVCGPYDYRVDKVEPKNSKISIVQAGGAFLELSPSDD